MRLALRIGSLVSLAGGLCLLYACAEEGGTDRGPDPGVLPDGGLMVEPDPGVNCPGSEPKVGESCGPDITESSRCEYTVGECVGTGGMTFNETVVYCCKTSYWETCGGRSPCAGSTVDAAEPPGMVLPPDGGFADATDATGG